MDAVQEIKSRLDIADLIGEYLPLKPAGTNAWKALCPFHQEKTPSFYVSRARQSWHCFGCDQGGDVISFVEKIEGMEFREVLEFLAQKTGVVLPKFDAEKTGQRKRLFEVNDLAVKFFRASLESLPQAEAARKYLEKRGVDALTADLFMLGYAPDAWSALTDALLKKGVTADELVRAGLAVKKESGGVYDRFRGRLMFPIADVHGNIVGFTARVLDVPHTSPHPSSERRGNEAKYVNTPETAVYRKSVVLYGLDKAKGAIRQQDLAVIVEGNMDVIGSHQFGVGNVVAASGTALTGEQLSLLKRFTTNLAIAFDQDAAGNAATLRGLDLARSQDFNIKIITLPPEAGKDPDEAVRKDPRLWKDAIASAVGIIEWIYRNAFRNRRSDRPEDKKLIARDVLPEIKRIADPVERDHWLRKLADDLGVSVEALKEAMGRADRMSEVRSQKSGQREEEKSPPSGQVEFEQRVLANVLFRHTMLAKAQALALKPSDFSAPSHAALYIKFLEAYPLDQSSPTAAGLAPDQPIRPPEGLTPDEAKLANALAFLAEREFQEMTPQELGHELGKGVAKLQELRKSRERQLLAEDMRAAERSGDRIRIAELAKRFEELNS